VIRRAKVKGHCIIVIAEGAFSGLVDEDKKVVIQKLGDVGFKPTHETWESPSKTKSFDLNIKGDLATYASQVHGIKLQFKYLDPKKAIRACPANAEDT
jgi:hypothetical protein